MKTNARIVNHVLIGSILFLMAATPSLADVVAIVPFGAKSCSEVLNQAVNGELAQECEDTCQAWQQNSEELDLCAYRGHLIQAFQRDGNWECQVSCQCECIAIEPQPNPLREFEPVH